MIDRGLGTSLNQRHDKRKYWAKFLAPSWVLFYYDWRGCEKGGVKPS